MQGRAQWSLHAALLLGCAFAAPPASAQLPSRDVGPSVVRPPDGRPAPRPAPTWRTPPESTAPAAPAPAAPAGGSTSAAAPEGAPAPAGDTSRRPPASATPPFDGSARDVVQERPDGGRRRREGRGRERAGPERDVAQRNSRGWLAQLGPFALGELCEERFLDLGRAYLQAVATAAQPVGVQRARLDDLARSMETAARTSGATCTGEVAITPPGQFDAIDRRLDSVLVAVRGVRTAMDALWSSLDDEQKARVTTAALGFERAGRERRRGRRRRR